MPIRTALVSGASIAGPALAYWLDRHGVETTVVERSEQVREEGQNVDVRGAGREVLRRMGLERAALAQTTHERGTAFVDEHGRRVATLPAATGDSDGATAELEILRGRLAQLLHQASAAGVQYRFGDQIVDLHDPGRQGGRGGRDIGGVQVEVTFASGFQQAYDVVLVAEGMRSRTRAEVFRTSPLRHLGMYCVYLTIERTADDDDYWRWYNALRGRSVTLRPDNTGTTRAALNFLSDTRGIDRVDRAGQVAVLRSVFDDAGWQTERVLQALDQVPFYFEDLAQVHQQPWSRGRTALVGDAAYCASPVSGMGTTLSLTGAYVLAAELAGADDHTAAFRRYEARMRPFVQRAQRLPPGVPWVANPRGRTHRALLRTGVRVASSAPARRFGAVTGRLFSPPADAFTLPAPLETVPAGGDRAS